MAQRNKEKILNAAACIFAERGIHNTTIDMIAHEAGVGKGTVYRLIGNKESIVALLIERIANIFLEEIKKNRVLKKTQALQLKEFIGVMSDVYESNMKLAMVFYTHHFVGIPSISSEKRSVILPVALEKRNKYVGEIIRRAIKEGEIKDIDPQVLLQGLVYFFNPFFYAYLRHEKKYTKFEIAHLVTDIYMKGILKKK